MSCLTLFTSGSTKEPKEVTHHWYDMDKHIQRSIDEIGLTKNDIVLDSFPSNVIAHYTVTAMPAIRSGASLVSIKFDPRTYIDLFNKYRPTYAVIIPRYYESLRKLKEWNNFDMSCVRYMVVGSGLCSQEMINDLKSRGVKLVANWYGMTEMPPPVFIGYDSEVFDFTPKSGYTVEFAEDGECIINGMYTGDVFDTQTRKFLHRKITATGKTWKTSEI